jgi:hypothetical protein
VKHSPCQINELRAVVDYVALFEAFATEEEAETFMVEKMGLRSTLAETADETPPPLVN